MNSQDQNRQPYGLRLSSQITPGGGESKADRIAYPQPYGLRLSSQITPGGESKADRIAYPQPPQRRMVLCNQCLTSRRNLGLGLDQHNNPLVQNQPQMAPPQQLLQMTAVRTPDAIQEGEKKEMTPAEKILYDPATKSVHRARTADFWKKGGKKKRKTRRKKSSGKRKTRKKRGGVNWKKGLVSALALGGPAAAVNFGSPQFGSIGTQFGQTVEKQQTNYTPLYFDNDTSSLVQSTPMSNFDNTNPPNLSSGLTKYTDTGLSPTTPRYNFPLDTTNATTDFNFDFASTQYPANMNDDNSRLSDLTTYTDTSVPSTTTEYNFPPTTTTDFKNLVDAKMENNTNAKQRETDDFCNDPDACAGSLDIPRVDMPQISEPEDLDAFEEVMKNNGYTVKFEKVNFETANIKPIQNQVRISTSKKICKNPRAEKVPVILIEGDSDVKGVKEKIILDGHHRSFAYKNCAIEKPDGTGGSNVKAIVVKKSGMKADNMAKDILKVLKQPNSQNINFFKAFAFGGGNKLRGKNKKNKKTKRKTKKTKRKNKKTKRKTRKR